jgi:hypothetical protein
MKKTLTVITLLAGAVAGYSQTVTFADYSQPGYMEQQVFNTQAVQPAGSTPEQVTMGGSTILEYLGSTSVDTSPGTVVFAGTAFSGNSFDAQVLAGAGAGDAVNTLTTLGAVEHFYTVAGTSLGMFKGNQTLTVPVDAGENVTVAFAAWTVNATGLLGSATTLAEAQTDTLSGDAGYAWGVSTTANLIAATGAENSPLMPESIEGFAVGTEYIGGLPEPSTIALGVMGASALLFRRRK